MNNDFNDVICKQPVLNIGMLGSVSDGKSSCVRALTGIKTQRHSSEKTRNITIKPGYANMKIWKNGNNLTSTDSIPTTHSVDNENYDLIHHVSFVDCPGHQELILTMLGSIELMNAVVIIVAASEPIDKKPQLIQHLAAVKLSGISNIIVCMNKIDLISKEVTIERKKELEKLLDTFDIKPKCIIPTCFNKKIGVNWLLEEIVKHFKLKDNSKSNTCFMATRSFDINKPGQDFSTLKGGVIGGSLSNGELKVNDIIEIRPGICGKKKDGSLNSQPIRTRVLSLQTDKETLNKIYPGGLIGIGTDIDPYYCKDDFLSGNIIGLEGKLPSVYESLELEIDVITDFGGNLKLIQKGYKTVFLQIGTMSIESVFHIFNNTKEKATYLFELFRPACVIPNNMIMISQKEEGIMKIVAVGHFKNGKKLIG